MSGTSRSTQKQNDRPGVKKLSFNLPLQVAGLLRELAEREGFSMTQILIQAIRLLKLIKDEQRRGSKILIQNGSVTKEIIIT